jgi:hypothetical protein
MGRLIVLLVVGSTAVAPSAAAGWTIDPSPATAVAPPTAAQYARAVSRICVGALLFDGAHAIGTRAGAVSVSRAIRATGSARLRRVERLLKPPQTAVLVEKWLGIEHRLVGLYASAYLLIWNEIEHGPRVRVLRALVDRPRPLELRAGLLETTLGLPDCTGASATTSEPPSGPA